MSKHWFAVLVLAALAFGAPAVVAQPAPGTSLEDPKTEAMAYDIASRTMSPFCPGRTLADCPSGNATEWRQDIRAMLQKGMSPAEIQKVLNKRAGENLSGAPESSLGWGLPVALVAGALIVLMLVLKRIRKGDAADAAATGTSSSRHAADDEDADEDADEDSDEDSDEEEAEDGAEAELPAVQQRSEKQERELEERLRRELADDDA